jgi:hypothetical protein
MITPRQRAVDCHMGLCLGSGLRLDVHLAFMGE